MSKFGTDQVALSLELVDQNKKSIAVDSTITFKGIAAPAQKAPAAAKPKLVLGLPKTANSGSPITATVTAKDAGGKVNAGFVGKVHFTSKDSSAALPADYTFTVADKGVHQFSVTFKTKGNQTLTAASPGMNSASGSTTVK